MPLMLALNRLGQLFEHQVGLLLYGLAQFLTIDLATSSIPILQYPLLEIVTVGNALLLEDCTASLCLIILRISYN